MIISTTNPPRSVALLTPGRKVSVQGWPHETCVVVSHEVFGTIDTCLIVYVRRRSGEVVGVQDKRVGAAL